MARKTTNTKFKDGENKEEYRGKNAKRRSNKSKPRNESKLDSTGRDNDPNWYFTNKDVAEQTAQLSFQNVLGFGDIDGYKIPSIVRYDLAMSPGCTYPVQNPTGIKYPITSGSEQHSVTYVGQPGPAKSGINMMAAKLYTTMSSFTGRTASYAPQDVAMMILGISSIAETTEAVRRMFGLLFTYNFRNRSVPLGILRTMGIDVDDFMANSSIYRQRFNALIARINQIPLLENIAFVAKSRDIYQRVYQDDPTDMSQLFYYMPSTAYRINETLSSTGTVLESVGFADTAYGYGYSSGLNQTVMSQLLDTIESQITAMLESSTLNFVYADILNMANKVGVKTWQFDYLAENYVVIPEYNQNALLQMHNLTVMGAPINFGTDMEASTHYGSNVYYTPGYSIFSDANTNNVVFNPLFADGYAAGCHSTIAVVDMPTDRPTIEDRIEALRFTSLSSGCVIDGSDFASGTAGDKYLAFSALPDHFVVNFTVFNNINYSAATLTGADAILTCLDSTWFQAIGAPVDPYVAFQGLEHAPLIYLQTTASGSQSLAHIMGGLQYYTTVDYRYVKRVLDMMYIGLFDFRI